MISDIWNSKKFNPIVLKSSSLYIGIKSYEIGAVYLFEKNPSRQVIKFGKFSGGKHINIEQSITGYFKSLPYNDFLRLGFINDLAIIGYRDRVRYYISNVDISKSNMNFSGSESRFTMKFSATEIIQETVPIK